MAEIRKTAIGGQALIEGIVMRGRHVAAMGIRLPNGEIEMTADGELRLIPTYHKELHDAIVKEGLYILQSGISLGTMKGKDIIPAHALALSNALKEDAFPKAEVDIETALNYLRRESICLPEDIETGHVLICYKGHPLGFVKNMGNRSNNLYPQEWRIRFC